MSSITIHNLDPELDKRLRELAEKEHLSLNKTIQKLLKNQLGLNEKKRKYADFEDFSGSWTAEDADEFNAAVKDFSKIDKEMWE